MVSTKEVRDKTKLKPTVSVVIPNWNGVYLMRKHLQKVIDASPGAEIIVADDMSTDGSVEYLHQEFPHVMVVERSKREGFAANVNAGVVKALGDIIVLLNTDVEPEKGYLDPLLREFADSSVFAVGSLEKSHEQGKEILRGRGVAHWEKGFYIHALGAMDKSDTAWVSGGSGAFRRLMWEKLDGMDTLYNPFYWEDIDLSYRARKCGWKARFAQKSVVHHYHEEGKIKREFTPDEVKRIVYRNQFTFIWKNATDTKILLMNVLWTPVRLVQALFRGDILMIEGYCLAVLRLFPIMSHKLDQSRMYTVSDASLQIMR